ncbi:hypothetical protein CUJ83_08540 [Methanocella sp. CWC-04]|uniref:Dinitrogenase iron-molybdenum cofactor biosynthesis domain-containing protein n=1 Tax=Methanooceanicella nereidis TaxID=2052831 RepID=A0AAP2RCZ0_9EURY|nr:NifB/NifX family molybdenum-iron cluster-binding protein [Methanocella sp. CWC-04]MCD1295043.1 hypothetical protein [Methanocella sp. CWC-04]
MTRYAIPITSPEGLSSPVKEHFAKSEYFVILEAEEDKIVSVDVLHNVPSEEGEKKAADFLADNGVNVVLAGSIGPCMKSILHDRGVKVFMGAEGTAEDAFKDHMAGKLMEVQKTGF